MIEPPIHPLYFRSGGATTLILIEDGARLCTSFWRRSAKPANMVEPPERMILASAPHKAARTGVKLKTQRIPSCMGTA
eukprot:2417291-Prymnesium_polylepis.1